MKDFFLLLQLAVPGTRVLLPDTMNVCTALCTFGMYVPLFCFFELRFYDTVVPSVHTYIDTTSGNDVHSP